MARAGCWWWTVAAACGAPSCTTPKGAEPDAALLIRKVYIVLYLQHLLTAVVAVVVVKVRAIPHFFASSYVGLGLYVFLLILPFIVISPVHLPSSIDSTRLLGVFTVAISFFVGLTCAFNSVDENLPMEPAPQLKAEPWRLPHRAGGGGCTGEASFAVTDEQWPATEEATRASLRGRLAVTAHVSTPNAAKIGGHDLLAFGV
ncbi:hypothetical protein ZWY2020_019921 [Hordeum vulgare]|nr:hypothetical protein ZWY2020_019921 [Hordeum vulgare]